MTYCTYSPSSFFAQSGILTPGERDLLGFSAHFGIMTSPIMMGWSLSNPLSTQAGKAFVSGKSSGFYIK